MNVDPSSWRHLTLSRWVGCAVSAFAIALAGCSKPADKPASQVAAQVNKRELTVHQVNFLLQQQRNIKPEQADSARHVALERLIDQELAIQKAEDIKLDRDPTVMQQVEAARREIIARAYFERVGGGASRPTDAAINKYYDENPALFSERRVYQLQEWFVEAESQQADLVRSKAQSSKSLSEFSDFLKASNIRFEFNQAIRAAEQLPLGSLATFAKMSEGGVLINVRPNGLQVIKFAGVRKEPVELDRVRPMIEQFLLNEQKTRIIADDLKALRLPSTIKYMETAPAGSEPAPPASTATGGHGLDELSVNKSLGIKP